MNEISLKDIEVRPLRGRVLTSSLRLQMTDLSEVSQVETSERSVICRNNHVQLFELGQVARFRHLLLALLCALGISVVNLSTVTAQPHNGEVYKNLIQNFFTETEPSNTKIDERYEAWIPKYQIDSSRNETVRIGGPDISYNKLKNKQFTRMVQVSVEIKDSVQRSEVLVYSDTLSIQELKEVQKGSPPDFRSELPTTYSKTLRPLAIVTASIAGVISLFYIRSR
ncbi:hypothetical protein N9933_02355 [bacterium]|nr:hypothetical protein [bacterium]